MSISIIVTKNICKTFNGDSFIESWLNEGNWNQIKMQINKL